ncbi:hypothetical protein I547_7345 [Mycobacterium kansasii 824]|nr:hypothetical protein I547_7345 [Mycobacterium kansasii 824]
MRTGIRLMIAGDYDQLSQLRENDLRKPRAGANGTDILDAALCDLAVFARSPRRGTTRHQARPRRRSRNSSMPAAGRSAGDDPLHDHVFAANK